MAEKTYKAKLAYTEAEMAKSLDELCADLPSSAGGVKRIVPTHEQLEALKKYYPTKSKDALAKAFGVSTNTLRRWWKEYNT